jgi:hypothetical protein
MSDDNKVTILIQCLNKYGIKYIYNNADSDNRYWIHINTAHMNKLFEFYDNFLKGYNYSMSIEINGKIMYISKEYKSIIDYFKNNSEFTEPNNIYKLVHLKYFIDVP